MFILSGVPNQASEFSQSIFVNKYVWRPLYMNLCGNFKGVVALERGGLIPTMD